MNLILIETERNVFLIIGIEFYILFIVMVLLLIVSLKDLKIVFFCGKDIKMKLLLNLNLP